MDQLKQFNVQPFWEAIQAPPIKANSTVICESLIFVDADEERACIGVDEEPHYKERSCMVVVYKSPSGNIMISLYLN